MRRRFLNSYGCLLSIAKLAVILILPTGGQTQSLPTSITDKVHFAIDPKEIFYDTRSIPDAVEVSRYLIFNETRWFFFPVEHSNTALSITLTPCASPILWSVKFKGEKSTGLPYYVSDIEKIISLPERKKERVATLYTFSGHIAETLHIVSAQVGTYTVEVTPLKRDTYVKFYVTTSPYSDRAYPELPLNSNVDIIGRTKNSVAVGWNPSPDERHFGSDIEYCIAVNRKRHYYTLCALESYMTGDAKPTLSPNVGFGFVNEKAKFRDFLDRAKPLRPEKEGSIYYTCLGNRTKFIYGRAKRGKKYFFDIFVRNKITNKASRYNGAVMEAAPEKRSISKLRDGKFKKVQLRRKKARTFQFKVKAEANDFLLAVHPCSSGNITLKVSRENFTLIQTSVNNFKKLIFKTVKSGVYIVTLTSKGRRRRTVHIFPTTKIAKFPYPKLPDDTSLKVFENLTSCNSITIAWMGTDTKQEYCLYKTELKHGNRNRLPKKLTQCDAMDRRKDSQKILCKKYRNLKKEQAVLAVTVTGLKPSTSYIFDVFVSSNRRLALPFNSIRTETKPKNMCP